MKRTVKKEDDLRETGCWGKGGMEVGRKLRIFSYRINMVFIYYPNRPVYWDKRPIKLQFT